MKTHRLAALTRAFTLAFLVLALACEGTCAGCGSPRPPPGTTALLPSTERLRVQGEGRATLELPVRQATLAGGVLSIHAVGSRDGWLHEVIVEQQLQVRAGALTPIPRGGRCVVRYLEDGRRTEADFVVADGTLTAMGPGGTMLASLRCRKAVDSTVGGTPYAAPLPDEVTLSVSVERSAPAE